MVFCDCILYMSTAFPSNRAI